MNQLYKLLFSLKIAIIGSTFSLIAQDQTYTIHGKVISNGIEIPGAVVLLSGFQANAITNENGLYSISNLKPGKYDVIVKMLGYDPASKNIEIINKNVNLDFTISENTKILNEVVIKIDNNRDYNLNIFIKNFIGESENSTMCKLLNPEVVQFSYDERNKILYASASDILKIENKALGYNINYLLKEFEVNFATNVVFYSGLPHFTPFKVRPAQQKNFIKNRTSTYLGSANHFFSSLNKGITEAEGFHVLFNREINNKDRQPENIIDSKIEYFKNPELVKNKTNIFSPADSLEYWRKEMRKPITLKYLDSSTTNINSLVRNYTDEIKELNVPDDVEEVLIIYDRSHEPVAFKASKFSINRPKKFKNYQATALKINNRSIKFLPNGILHEPRAVSYFGYWSFAKLADRLPLDEEFK